MPTRTECGDCPPDAPCDACNGHGWMWLLTLEEYDDYGTSDPSNTDLRDLLSRPPSEMGRASDMGQIDERSMEAILKFPLPECQHEFNDATNGWKYMAVLQSLDEELRQMHKYRDINAIDPFDVREMICEYLAEYNLGLWE